MTPEFYQPGCLCFGFNTFGQHRHSQRVSKWNHDFSDSCTAYSAIQCFDEGTVDLNSVGGQAIKVRKGREACAKVIEGNGDTTLSDGVKQGLNGFGSFDCDGLRDFELKLFDWDSCFGNHVIQHFQKSWMT